jgi:hypothetical protein
MITAPPAADSCAPPAARQGRGQRRATLRRNGERATPAVAHRHSTRPFANRPHRAPKSEPALTDPVQANIIVSDPRKQTSGGRHQIGTLAGFKSESWPAHMGSLGSREIIGARASLLLLLAYPRSEPIPSIWRLSHQIKLTFGRRLLRLHQDPACGG